MRPAAATLKRWRERDGILDFIRESFQVEPDAWQREGALAFADPSVQRVSLQACAGPGKTALMAWCGWWFLATQGAAGEHPKGACISITGENLRDNLWAEFAKWQSRSPFLSAAFEWTSTRIFSRDHPETWFLSARSWPKSASAEEQGKTLSGVHSRFVLFLVDESGGIPTTVARSAEQALGSCEVGKIMQAGNPIKRDGMLGAAATTQRHLWTVVRITGDPDDPNRSPRIDIEWARQQIATYGRENPWVQAYILGQFPAEAINALLSSDEVEEAMKRHLRSPEFDWAQKRIGVDVARFGDDRTVIFPRQGLASFRPVVMRTARTTDIAARVASARASWGAEIILVDDTGHWGHGVIDGLLAARINAVGIQFHAPALDPRYKNRRAEMWISMAEWVKRGGALPPIPELVGELTTPTYTFVNGAFLLEDKDLVKKRLGRSPDLADALALTFALPDQPAAYRHNQRARRHVETDFDPYRDGRTSDRAEVDFDPYRGVEA